jgi:hypothetical protein
MIEQTMLWSEGPPEEIILYKEIAEEQGLQGLLTKGVGGIFCLAGLAIVVYGVKATKRLRIRKKKSRK